MNGKRLLFVLLFLLSGCGSDNDNASGRPDEMRFDVDQDLLGEVIVSNDSGLTFQPPKQWSRITGRLYDEAFDQLTRGQTDTNRFTVIPRYIFLNHHNGSAMILSEVEPGVEMPVADDIVTVFRAHLSEGFDDKDYTETEFLKDGTLYYQYLTQTDGMVNFKFLFLNSYDVLYQLDYVVPNAVYAAESKAIESSIGSIQINNEE